MIYQVITDQSLLELQRKVNHALSRDWIPAGGIITYSQVSHDPTLAQPRLFFAQAIMSYAGQSTLPAASGTTQTPAASDLQPRHYKD